MKNALRMLLTPPRVTALLAVFVVSACSGSGGTAAPETESLIEDQSGSEPLPKVLVMLDKETELISAVPDIAHTQTMANTGLQISYTLASLLGRAPPASIEAQWVFMQACLAQNTVAPLVIVREGQVEPFTVADDVVRNEQISAIEITSAPIASASLLHGPVIQVSVTDFDGSLGTPLFNLRSIIGRYLWLSNNLPERDYPFECARQQP